MSGATGLGLRFSPKIGHLRPGAEAAEVWVEPPFRRPKGVLYTSPGRCRAGMGSTVGATLVKSQPRILEIGNLRHLSQIF